MTIMAAACGILIVVLGLLSGWGRTSNDAQSAIEIICLVGGLILCFVAVVLARLSALAKRLDGFEVAADTPTPSPASDADQAAAAGAADIPSEV